MTFQVVLFTIIEMHITEEYTNSHGFRRFAPESTNESHVSICYAATAFEVSKCINYNSSVLKDISTAKIL